MAARTAATASGARIGKGGGYSDLELAIAMELALAEERTLVVTVRARRAGGELPLAGGEPRMQRLVAGTGTGSALACKRLCDRRVP